MEKVHQGALFDARCEVQAARWRRILRLRVLDAQRAGRRRRSQGSECASGDILSDKLRMYLTFRLWPSSGRLRCFEAWPTMNPLFNYRLGQQKRLFNRLQGGSKVGRKCE